MTKKLTDNVLEELLTINGHCVFDSLDETIAFDQKSDKDREEIVKAVVKAIEVSTIVTCRLFDIETLDTEKIGKIANAIVNKNFEEANYLLAPL